ncbi:MAG: cytochrome c3 family protein [Anaerolineales bacterium]|nr:cytochrome c3 family protein [Anaerolineales bacterium]
MKLKNLLITVGALVIFGVIISACGTTPTTAPTEPPAPTEAPALVPETPYLADWQSGGHADVDGEPFRHWDAEDPAEVPVFCAKCHTSAGYEDFIGADGSEAGKVESAVPAKEAQGVQCAACHNPVTISKTTVTFPSGVTISAGDDVRCMECHQGRESKVSVDKQIEEFGATNPDEVVAPIKDAQGNDVTFGFRNVHYYAAAATLYGGKTMGGYQYDGLTYDSKNTHVDGYDSCVGCHDPHTLAVKVQDCANCHEDVATVDDLKSVRMVSSARDYDGDGDVKEGMYYEIEGLQDILYAEIQKYSAKTAGAALVYDAHAYPYFFIDTNANGEVDDGETAFPNGYTAWTPRLVKAAYNYQVSLKDTGAYAHGNKYIVQLLYDSIADLGGDTNKLARTDAGHFAGNTEPFRHWDAEEEGNGTVPFGCVKCHTATGLPAYLTDGGTTLVTSSGTTQIVGLSAMPASNGFMCTTCHNGESFPDRYSVNSVVFPSGKTVSYGGQDADGNFLPDDSNLCISCHQGRESTTSMNNALRGKELDTVDAKIRFKNIHYFAAGATLFGAEVQGAYMYEGKEYVSRNLHASDEGKANKCQDCHDVHALEPKVESCETCHDTADPKTIRETEVDYDGDGDAQEGMSGEVATLAEALYAQMQVYAEAHGGALTYDGHAYPYYFGADGKAYAAWTPRLVKAAFNYQYVQKDPGAYVHNPKFVIQFLIDSIADLGGDVSGYTRP